MATEATPFAVGYARQEPTKPAPWPGLVAWDMLCNNLSTGLFLVAALAELVSPDTFTPVARVAYPVALLFLLTDLTLLVVDLGDVRRFHHMLRVFKPGSPMSFGIWSLTAYSLPLTVAALLSLFPVAGAWEWVRRAAVVLGILPALASAVYKGVLLSTSAQPGWKEARWLGGYLTSAAVVLGCAGLIVLAYLTDQPRAAEALRPALAILLLVHSVPLILLTLELRPALARALTPGQRGSAAVVVTVGGVLLPLALVIADGGAVWMMAAALLIVLANLAARFVLVRLPHQAG
jgi:Ni/Fe-hydrogenase subunit HybB-like protein